jgi:imidazole glycerol phosphate synthase subunit HisF
MEMMGWGYPKADIELPEFPEEEYNGEWGTQYIQHETRCEKSAGYKICRTGNVFDREIVKYETETDARAAAELSSNLLSSRGQITGYDINIVRWDEDVDEWILVESVE